MSGFEVVGVILGVLPILIETVKAYSSVYSSLRTFRHYSKEVKTIQIQFSVHHGIFINECRLLLCMIEDEHGAKEMLDDTTDPRWNSKELNDRLSGILKDNLQLCRSIIEASKDRVEDLRAELEKFDVLTEQMSKGEPIKSTIRRLRSAVRITLDKSRYVKSLADLRDSNADLTHLRSQFQQQRHCSDSCVGRKPLPSRLNAIRTASQKLHKALTDAWCCGDQTHSSHWAKLCLDAEVEAEVRLDLAISCHKTEHEHVESSLKEPPIWLYVQSVSIETLAFADPLPQISSSFNKRPRRDDSTSPPPEPVSSKPALNLPGLAGYKRKKKSVRFKVTNQDGVTTTFSEAATEQLSIIKRGAAQMATPYIDLCQTKNFCHYLKQNLHLCGTSLTKHCVGYLESPDTYRHMFFLQQKHASSNSILKDPEQTSLCSIFDLMGYDANEALTVVEQLSLAHKVAVATLQFNDTPWLAQRWRLKDLSYFGTRKTFNDDALKSLHLSSRMSAATECMLPSMEGIEHPVPSFSEEDFFGINNTTLFFLGVALLELAHWKPLEKLSTQQDPNEILTARRLASRPTPLGPKYSDMIRKCLQCNFGFGTDLNKKELQAAVYGDVVCQLENMIESLSI